MTEQLPPRIGLILEGEVRDALTQALSVAGYEVRVVHESAQLLTLVAANQLDAWVFDARDDDTYEFLLTTGKYLLPADNAPRPSDLPRFTDWSAGLIQQLDSALGEKFRGAAERGNAALWDQVRGVWLLAGSAGATPAIQQFLNSFSKPPPVAFIYAQHYDPRKQLELEQFTLENEAFTLYVGEGMHTLAPGRVIMIPPHCKVSIGGFGQLSSIRSSWGSEHTPDINELLYIISGAKLASTGVIIFSGMGRDGAAALAVQDAAGGHIWAQSPDSAICDGMPRAAIATGLVRRTGTPEQLATALQLLYSQ